MKLKDGETQLSYTIAALLYIGFCMISFFKDAAASAQISPDFNVGIPCI